MKKLNIFVLALALLTVNIAAADPNPIKASAALRMEIVDLIGTNVVAEMEAEEHNAEVLFTVNSKQELIVLSVETDNDQLESHLKKKLNFKKVNHRPSKNGEIYFLPVKMIK